MSSDWFLLLSRSRYFRFPKMAWNSVRSSLRWRPCLVVGMPVLRAMRCFNAVMPSARFQLKVSPGMRNHFFFVAMALPPVGMALY